MKKIRLKYFLLVRWFAKQYLVSRYAIAISERDGTVAAASLILLQDMGLQDAIIKLTKDGIENKKT